MFSFILTLFKILGKTIPMDGDYFAYTRHEPVGVCGQMYAIKKMDFNLVSFE